MEGMNGEVRTAGWKNIYRFMFFLFSGVEQWMCCMILFCGMLYVLHCSAFYFPLIDVILVQHPMYHQTSPTVT
jgi:hypothetical protein